MPTIGIVTCQILELEFAHLMSTDRQVSDIFVIDNKFSQDLISELKAHGKKTGASTGDFERIRGSARQPPPGIDPSHGDRASFQHSKATATCSVSR